MEEVGQERTIFEERFNQAVFLSRDNRTKEAIDQLKFLAQDFPDSAAVWGVLGLIYYVDVKDFDAAAFCLQQATRISPASEKASVGLFHALWEGGRRQEAVDEAHRFLAIRPQELFEQIAVEYPR